MKTESLLMRFFRKIGVDSVAWSLRRIHCPVPKSALVLEVGSGGNPYARANVLLDAYEATRERHWVPLVKDRPTVFGFAEKLPFADKSFDFIIASHVLEHSHDPVRFLSELQRVAKAGYIEVPDAFMERLNPYRDHRLEIAESEGRLIITKKPDWCVDEGLQSLYQPRVKKYVTQELMRRRPFAFHVRYYWSDVIDAEVTNPDVSVNWSAPNLESEPRAKHRMSLLKWSLLIFMRRIGSQHRRNQQIDLFEIIRCTNCRSTLVKAGDDQLCCAKCQHHYLVREGVPDMTQELVS